MELLLSIITVLITGYILVLITLYFIHKKIFGNRFTINPLINYYKEEDFNCVPEPLDFKIGDLNIKGKLIKPSSDTYNKDKIIVFCHGMWSSKEAYIQDAAYIASKGFLTYIFDYIGTNESDGKSIGGLALGLKAVDYAIKFIHEKYKDLDIYLYGHSWGAFNALNSLKYNPYVKKVCAISPFLNINTAIAGLLDPIYKPVVYNTAIIEGMKFGKYAFSNSINSLKNYQGKALIIHSKDDNMIKFNNSTKQIYLKYKDNPNFKFIIVDNKNHNPQYCLDSIRQLNEFQAKIKTLKAEEQIEYMKTIDFSELGKLDIDLMNQIISFFNE